MQDMRTTLSAIPAIANRAWVATGRECLCDSRERWDLSESSPAFWQRLQAEVALPLAATAEDGDEAAQTQLAVDVAEALAARPCAHPACTTVDGPSEASMRRGKTKTCSGCRLVRYCGAACQKADWRAHRVACREVAARRRAAAPSEG